MKAYKRKDSIEAGKITEIDGFVVTTEGGRIFEVNDRFFETTPRVGDYLLEGPNGADWIPSTAFESLWEPA